jgi:hypothetical protein
VNGQRLPVIVGAAQQGVNEINYRIAKIAINAKIAKIYKPPPGPRDCQSAQQRARQGAQF